MGSRTSMSSGLHAAAGPLARRPVVAQIVGFYIGLSALYELTMDLMDRADNPE